MNITLDTSLPVREICFGETVIPAAAYSLRAEQPLRTAVLCDGTVRHRLLRDAACTLTVTGAVPASGGMALCCALQAAMRTHQTEDLTLDGAVLSDMQISALAYSTAKHKMVTEFSVTMTGTMKGDAAT